MFLKLSLGRISIIVWCAVFSHITRNSVGQVLISPQEQINGFFGYAVAGVGGDVNNDGIYDVVVGATFEAPVNPSLDVGRAYIFSGANGIILDTLVAPKTYPSYFGFSVSGTGGDLNGDGKPDIIVGAPTDTSNGLLNGGKAYVFSGADGTSLFTLASSKPDQNGFFGWSVAGIGDDVNSDGIPDLLVGAYFETSGAIRAGRAFVFNGADGSVVDSLVSPNGEANGSFGRVVASVGGDVNGDGVFDIIIGAPGEGPGASPGGAGRAYIFSGADRTLLTTLVSPNEESAGNFGWSVASVVGDINGDGKSDVIVGAYTENPGSSPSNAGRAYVFSGTDGTLLLTLTSPNEEIDGHFGRTVAGAGGDLNGDGKIDVIVGAHNEDEGIDPTDAGRAYFFSGADGVAMKTMVSPNKDTTGGFGFHVAPVGGDVNGDGIADVVIGAGGEDPTGSPDGAGRAYIFSGESAYVVPVELLSFSAKPYEELSIVEAKWLTATEINNDYFQIERSKDLLKWELVNEVDAVGNSSKEQAYEAVDEKPYSGTSYYRLLQIDKDGTKETFGPVAVRLEGVDIINLWPNPSSEKLNFEVVIAEEGIVNVKILDELGRLVQSREKSIAAGSNILTLDLNSIAAGEYMIEVQTESLERSHKLFVVGEQAN